MSDKSQVTVDKATRRVKRKTPRGYKAHLAWCSVHDEPVWVYSDGSWGCPYDYVVSFTEDHALAVAPWEVHA